jgi:hypothetical protein
LSGNLSGNLSASSRDAGWDSSGNAATAISWKVVNAAIKIYQNIPRVSTSWSTTYIYKVLKTDKKG